MPLCSSYIHVFPLCKSSLNNLLIIILDLIFIFKKEKKSHITNYSPLQSKETSYDISILARIKLNGFKITSYIFLCSAIRHFYGNTGFLYYCIEFTKKTLAM